MFKSDEGKGESGGDTQTDNGPAGLDDGVVGETTAQIPGQMAETVHAVVGERQGQSSLEGNLGRNRESTHGSDHGGRLQVPAEGGREQVCGGPQVEGTGHDDARDTVQRGADPAHLGLVDGQMGGDGAVETLLGENRGRVLVVRGGSDGSKGNVSFYGWLRMTSAVDCGE